MEIWKNIPQYRGIYQVSSLGRVKSLKFGKERILKNSLDKKGYVRVNLFKNGIALTFFVHQLVALTFIENPLLKDQVNHKNGDKLNNCLSNLEWCTSVENIRHAYKTGLNGKERKARLFITSLLKITDTNKIHLLCTEYLNK